MWAALAKAKIDIPLKQAAAGTLNEKDMVDVIVKAGTEITITHGGKEKYALWGHGYIWDLPEEYVGKIVLVYSEK